MQIASALLNEMLQGVGKTITTLDSRIQPFSVFNEAGRELFTRHRWSWRGDTATLEAVAGQEYIALPDDFAAMTFITIPGGTYSVIPVSLGQIRYYRQSPVAYSGSGGAWFVSFDGWTRQANPELLPTPRVDLYPTPTTDGTPTLTLEYQRKWREMQGTDPTAVPNIPNNASRALKLLGRAAFKRLHDDYAGAQADEAEYEKQIERMIQEDTPQMNYGRSRGGAGDCPEPGRSVSTPYVQDVTWS